MLDDEEEHLGIEEADVAGMHPPVAQRLRALFRRALCDALLDSNEKLNIGTSIPAHVVDMEAVRPKFYAIYLPKGDNPEQQQDSRKHAFRRAVEKAQLASLIGVRVEPGGRTLLWLTAPEPIA